MATERGAVLVTGALGGLGTAIAQTLCARGSTVLACDRRVDDVDGWRARVTAAKPGSVRFYPLDVTKEDQVNELAQTLVEQGIHVAYLVNNAGIQGNANIWEFHTRAWERVIRVNLHGTFYLTRAFSRAMVERGFGRIVNLASLYAYHPGPGQSPYAAAKAAITGFTRSVALDLAKHGVMVNVIAPGIIWHEGLRGVLPEEAYATLIGGVPAGRAGKPEEIAATVAFLLSDGAAYITGQTIHVNGGLYLPG